MWFSKRRDRELICQSGIIGEKRGGQGELGEEGFYWLYMAGGPGEAMRMPFLLHSTLQQFSAVYNAQVSVQKNSLQFLCVAAAVKVLLA